MMKAQKQFIKKSMLWFLASLLLVSPIFSLVVKAEESTADSQGLLGEIKDRGVIRMGVASGYAPFEFIVNEGGENQVTGSDIFLGEKIAEDLGVELEIVDMEFPNLITSMEAGQIDMIISGLSYTEERDQSIDFSKAYHTDQQSFSIRAEDADKLSNYQDFIDQKLAVGVQENTVQETLIRQMFPEDAEIVVMKKSGDLVAALQAGNIDGFLADDAVAKAFEAENKDLAVIPSELNVEGSGAEKAVGIPEGESQLQAAINQSIDQVQADGLYDQYLEEAYHIISSNQGDSIWQYWPYFWDGIKTTLLISFVSILVGVILGSLLALMRISGQPLIAFLGRLYVEVVRGTPLMIQVLFIYIGLASVFDWSTLTSGLVAVSLNSGAYVCEIIRGGINAVNKGQSEAGRALGLNYWTTMKEIVFPQSLRSIWPALGNEFVTLIKESSIVSTIGVAELTFQTRNVTSLSYKGVEPLIISMLVYLFLTFTLTQCLNLYEKQMSKKY